jgi:hypothetical protein
VSTTDDILALASAARTPADAPAGDQPIELTGAHLAAFREAASRGRDSAAARALLKIHPPVPPSGEAAWAAWALAAAAAGGSAPAHGHEDDKGAGAAGGTRLTWLAVFAAGTALADAALADPAGGSGRVTVLAAIAAGMSASAITESGLADWGGWSSGTVAAVVGAGVTAGLLLGLTPPQLRAAIGICATQAAGLRAAAGTDAFALQVGKAAFNGVEAALLARAGLTAPAEPLDGRRGLFALFGG